MLQEVPYKSLDTMWYNLRLAFSFQRYRDVFEHQDEVILELDAATHDNPVFEQLFKEFEMQKVCYLPLSTFLLKPYQRLLHYQLILNSKLYIVVIWQHSLSTLQIRFFSYAVVFGRLLISVS